MTDIITKHVKTLRWIADHIEQVGLNQDGGYFSVGAACHGGTMPTNQAPCCVLGAQAVYLNSYPMLNEDPSDDLFYDAEPRELRSVIRNYIPSEFHRSISDWSDHTPQDEVLATLRRIADELESVGG